MKTSNEYQQSAQLLSISIIIPIYKVELYVQRCIESIIKQEDCGTAIECILVDDCSPDNSMSVVYSVIDGYKGPSCFVFLKHDHNRGLSAARNTGMDTATGDYILFVDSDDWLPADALSKFVSALQRYPDLDMVIGNCYLRNSEKLLFETVNETLLDNYQARKLLLCSVAGACSAWNKLVKTELAKRFLFKESIFFEDQPWTYFLFVEIDRALLIPDNTYFYENNHSDSIVHTSKNQENISRLVKSVCYIGNTILDSAYKDLFSDSIFFFWNCFFKVYRLQYEKYLLEDVERFKISQLRNRLIKTCFKKGRLALTLFIFAHTYPPTSYLYNITWVRNHYISNRDKGQKLTHFLERFHRNV